MNLYNIKGYQQTSIHLVYTKSVPSMLVFSFEEKKILIKLNINNDRT